ncbi:CPBP family intramembrane metalloprotease [Oscillospiraceae bacterium CM]|nr:CPBP family intramembrane metalloprotease [Oscillospiraceae bacterium CM]
MKKKAVILPVAGIVSAFILWYVIFVVSPMNFWLSMCLGVLLLAGYAVMIERDEFRHDTFRVHHIALGLLSAALLYGCFYVGNILAGLFIPAKDTQIMSVYANRTSLHPVVIGAALLVIIGPGEELFWRGFIQKSLKRFGVLSIVLQALIYALVHAVTFNFMLIMAALVCGLFWGALYYWKKSIYPVIISHAVWDVTVFLLLPFHR